MHYLIIESIIICILVLCVWYTMQEGEIFEKLGNFFEKNLPHQIHPAVFGCNVCMTPWYGSFIYWTFPWREVALPSATLIAWPVVVLVAMGFNIIINKWETPKE